MAAMHHFNGMKTRSAAEEASSASSSLAAPPAASSTEAADNANQFLEYFTMLAWEAAMESPKTLSRSALLRLIAAYIHDQTEEEVIEIPYTPTELAKATHDRVSFLIDASIAIRKFPEPARSYAAQLAKERNPRVQQWLTDGLKHAFISEGGSETISLETTADQFPTRIVISAFVGSPGLFAPAMVQVGSLFTLVEQAREDACLDLLIEVLSKSGLIQWPEVAKEVEVQKRADPVARGRKGS